MQRPPPAGEIELLERASVKSHHLYVLCDVKKTKSVVELSQVEGAYRIIVQTEEKQHEREEETLNIQDKHVNDLSSKSIFISQFS